MQTALLFECANCGKHYELSALNPITDLAQRVAPGETVPHGQCANPECAAFCYPAPELPASRTYRVEWAIDINATSAKEAAKKALAIQRDPDSIATVFDVVPFESDGFDIETIDLS